MADDLKSTLPIERVKFKTGIPKINRRKKGRRKTDMPMPPKDNDADDMGGKSDMDADNK